MIFEFVESHPIVSSIIVCIFFLLSTAFDLFVFKKKIVAIWSFVFGVPGIIGCITGAMKFSDNSSLIVKLILALYIAVTIFLWWFASDKRQVQE